MFVECSRHSSGELRVANLKNTHLASQRGQHADQAAAPGGVNQRVMEPEFVLQEADDPAGGEALPDGFELSAVSVQRRLIQVRKRTPHRQRLERGPNIVELMNVLDRVFADPKTAARIENDQLILGEAMKRLADRRAAEPKLGGESGIGQTFPRPAFAGDDEPPYPLIGMVDRGREGIPFRSPEEVEDFGGGGFELGGADLDSVWHASTFQTIRFLRRVAP